MVEEEQKSIDESIAAEIAPFVDSRSKCSEKKKKIEAEIEDLRRALEEKDLERQRVLDEISEQEAEIQRVEDTYATRVQDVADRRAAIDIKLEEYASGMEHLGQIKEDLEESLKVSARGAEDLESRQKLIQSEWFIMTKVREALDKIHELEGRRREDETSMGTGVQNIADDAHIAEQALSVLGRQESEFEATVSEL